MIFIYSRYIFESISEKEKMKTDSFLWLYLIKYRVERGIINVTKLLSKFEVLNWSYIG